MENPEQVVWNKGKKLSVEHREKLRKNHSGMRGRHHSKETRRKMSEAQIGKIIPREQIEKQRASLLRSYRNGLVVWNKGTKGVMKKNRTSFKKGGIGRGKYAVKYMPNHPNCSSIGLVYVHRLVMEKKLGRFLKKGETVHHINGDRGDNSVKNLLLFESNSAHRKHHDILRLKEGL